MDYDKKYPEVYRGYFNYRDPFTQNLEDIYKKPIVIPIYHLDELFSDQALAEANRWSEIKDIAELNSEWELLDARLTERDEHIFKYFHFIAAQLHMLYELKSQYRDYYELEHTLKQFEAIGYDVHKARESDLQKRKTLLLNFQARLCDRQFA